jgi:hypothetical protein
MKTPSRLAALASCAVAAILPNVSAAARSTASGAVECLAVKTDSKRLACYDREVRKLIEPRFSGRLNVVTERFEVKEPTRLRYQSDGAIFVLYVKTGDDDVVQNLHLGGGGEDSYVIEKPGNYFLQVNGSEGWRIWLEPL